MPLTDTVPTIKGMFVSSHVSAVRRAKGEEGVRALERLYGKSLAFRNSERVPVREEVRIIECALDILTGHTVSPAERAFEAGRLHFRNFTTTPFGRLLFPMFRGSFRKMMLRTKNIGGHVFEGVRFSSVDRGESEVVVRMENADYPIDHFRGLFYEWLLYAGHSGSVEASEPEARTYEYVIRWNPS